MKESGNKPVLALVGAEGMLGTMVRNVMPTDYRCESLNHAGFDLTDPVRVRSVLGRMKPRVIVNCAGFTDVDGCESREGEASLVNGIGPGALARAARETGATLVHISTDYVFDGMKREPYREEDEPHPVSAYGRTKLQGEREILASGLHRFFIIRTSWLFGPNGRNFVETILRLAGEREELRIVDDQVGCPTFTGDLAAAIFTLIQTDRFGVFHFANAGHCSWYGFAEEIVRQARLRGEDLKVKAVLPIASKDYPLPAPRPAFSVLATNKFRRVTGTEIAPWPEALGRFLTLRN